MSKFVDVSDEDLVQAVKDARDWKSWRTAMANAVDRLSIRRDQSLCGYDSRAALEMSKALSDEPSHELVAAHCGSHPDTHRWGKRVIANGYAQDKLVALSRLLAGPHGGIV